jgi:hypothetical protein
MCALRRVTYFISWRWPPCPAGAGNEGQEALPSASPLLISSMSDSACVQEKQREERGRETTSTTPRTEYFTTPLRSTDPGGKRQEKKRVRNTRNASTTASVSKEKKEEALPSSCQLQSLIGKQEHRRERGGCGVGDSPCSCKKQKKNDRENGHAHEGRKKRERTRRTSGLCFSSSSYGLWLGSVRYGGRLSFFCVFVYLCVCVWKGGQA